MKKFIILIGMGIGGWLGWHIGSYIGFMTAFFLSIIGTSAGMYAAKMIVKNYIP